MSFLAPRPSPPLSPFQGSSTSEGAAAGARGFDGGVCAAGRRALVMPWDLSAAYAVLLMIEKLPQQLVMDR